MMTIREVAEAWSFGKSAKAKNLYSDGRSLWSYEWYEIARRINSRIVLLRSDKYSRTTAKHIGMATAASCGNIQIHTNGTEGVGSGVSRLLDPDWDWVLYTLEFSSMFNHLTSGHMRVKIKKDINCRGLPALASARDCQWELVVKKLVISEPGLIVVKIPYEKRVQYDVLRDGRVINKRENFSVGGGELVKINYANVVRVHPVVDASSRLINKFVEAGPRWKRHLFPDIEPQGSVENLLLA